MAPHGHAVQVTEPIDGVKYPAGQFIQSPSPEEYVPTGQGIHPLPLYSNPGPHASHSHEPAGEKSPGGHGIQDVDSGAGA